MIFVTVGTHVQGFERLIRAMDRYAGRTSEKVVMQTGNTSYEPRNCRWFRFVDSQSRLAKEMKAADIVITHGGAGSIINSLNLDKKTIVAPRYKKYGEHVNDHQADLAKALEKEGKVFCLYDMKDLDKILRKAREGRLKTGSTRAALVRRVREFLEEAEHG